MCGIAAFQGRNSARKTEVLLNKLLHRGPDGSGVATQGSTTIGMCHLSLRSRRAQSMPLRLTEKIPIAAYNGEIYTKTINGVAHQPSTIADEVSALIVEDSTELDGMFAAVAVDHTKAMAIYRDHFGIVPLFSKIERGGVAVASEVAALITSRDKISLKQLLHFLVAGSPQSGATLFRDIKIVAPGSGGRQNGNARDYNSVESNLELEDRIVESWRLCSRSTRPIALLYSGGVDSTALALAGKLCSTSSLLVVQAVGSIIGQAPQKIPWRCPWNYHAVRIDPTEISHSIPVVLKATCHPLGRSSVYVMWVLADALHSQAVSVAISGEGADELFLGYSSYEKLMPHSSISANKLANHYISKESIRTAESLFGSPLVRRIVSEKIDEALYSIGKFGKLDGFKAMEICYSLWPLLWRNDLCFFRHAIEPRVPFLHAGIPSYARRFERYEGKKILRTMIARHCALRVAQVPKIPLRLYGREFWAECIELYREPLEFFCRLWNPDPRTVIATLSRAIQLDTTGNSAQVALRYLEAAIWWAHGNWKIESDIEPL